MFTTGNCLIEAFHDCNTLVSLVPNRITQAAKKWVLVWPVQTMPVRLREVALLMVGLFFRNSSQPWKNRTALRSRLPGNRIFCCTRGKRLLGSTSAIRDVTYHIFVSFCLQVREFSAATKWSPVKGKRSCHSVEWLFQGQCIRSHSTNSFEGKHPRTTIY